jgi:hypothetical protein
MDKTPVEKSDNKMFYTFSKRWWGTRYKLKKNLKKMCSKSSFFVSFSSRGEFWFLFRSFLLRLLLNIWSNLKVHRVRETRFDSFRVYVKPIDSDEKWKEMSRIVIARWSSCERWKFFFLSVRYWEASCKLILAGGRSFFAVARARFLFYKSCMQSYSCRRRNWSQTAHIFHNHALFSLFWWLIVY